MSHHAFGGARDVFGTRNGLQVVRIYASAVAAEVIEVKSLLDRPNPMLVGNSICESILAVVPETAIAVVQGSGPFPTAGFRNLADLLHESDRLRFSHTAQRHTVQGHLVTVA